MIHHTLIDTVIKNDYCIGCGACAVIAPTQFEIAFDKFGMYKAKFKNQAEQNSAVSPEKVCPFSDNALNENEIADLIYSETVVKSEYLGNYISTYAGHVNEGSFREKGSSGGFGKWLLNELLEINEVDYILQMVPQPNKNELFHYKVFKKGDDILSGSTSAYYPIRLDKALETVKQTNGSFAITALPCMSKAIRSLSMKDDILKKRIKYVLGIVCGHLKSTAFAESFAWQLGVNPKDLKNIEFREKIPGNRANEKGVYVIDKDDKKSKTISSLSLVGGNWGHGLFKYKACEFCDDVVAETADVSIGDAWLEEYINDSKGTNIVIIRNKIIDEIVRNAILKKRLELNQISENKVYESQAGGFRHRREGLAHRLYLQSKKKEWTPIKRVKPAKENSSKRRKIYELRELIRQESHEYFLEAKEKDDINIFINNVDKRALQLSKIYKRKTIRNYLGSIKRFLLSNNG